MTGYTVHTGSTTKFSEGWERIFGVAPRSSARPAKSPKASQAKPAKAAKKTPAKTAVRTAAGKTGTAKTVRSRRAAQTARASRKR